MEQEKDIEYRLVDKILLPDFQSSLIFLPINQNLWNTAHNEQTIDKSIKKAVRFLFLREKKIICVTRMIGNHNRWIKERARRLFLQDLCG